MKTISVTFFSLILLVMLSGCGSDEPAKNAVTPTSTLKTTKVESVQLPIMYNTSGRVQSANDAQLSTNLMGRIASIPVSIGQTVTKGTVLMRLSSETLMANKTEVNARLLQANAHFENVEKNYNRMKALFEKGSATQKEMDDISTMFTVAKNDLTVLKQKMREVDEMLSYAIIRAPFDGTVTRINKETGEHATPGFPLIHLSSSTAFEIETYVPTSLLSYVQVNDTLTFSVNDEVYQGVVSAISEAAGKGSFQHEVTLLPLVTSLPLVGNQYCEVHVPTEILPTVWIPASSVFTRGGLKGVFIKSNGSLQIRWVKLGRAYEGGYIVQSGLRSGEEFVTSAQAAAAETLTSNNK